MRENAWSSCDRHPMCFSLPVAPQVTLYSTPLLSPTLYYFSSTSAFFNLHQFLHPQSHFNLVPRTTLQVSNLLHQLHGHAEKPESQLALGVTSGRSFNHKPNPQAALARKTVLKAGAHCFAVVQLARQGELLMAEQVSC